MPIRVKAAGPPGASGRMEKSTRRFSEEPGPLFEDLGPNSGRSFWTDFDCPVGTIRVNPIPRQESGGPTGRLLIAVPNGEAGYLPPAEM
ncbi:hypothetical protein AnigIFM59636_006818 [Aspergillus niger]|nr:hypothetical protein AnigIFM59636_006818 [Aspergillus niger]